ncbi:zinc finger protein 512B-like isoform X1 [Pseudomyrmex gracilis]|uniref:zinc finger protein 512B-like isoform X1 n=1 Tax=Pseudomyrmex gracilis TaxID=219809 RepID=UPI0009955262|nr:zinc finger protein 512B-like isoform X1 [Pseudomyrmex gracilis]
MFLLSSILILCYLTKATIASFAGSESGWHGVSSYGSTGQNINIHQNLGYSSYGNGDLHTGMGHEVNHGNIQHLAVQSIPISEHIEVTKPVVVPVVKNIGIPVAQPVAIPVPHPVAVAVAQPYPIHVPVAHPVPVPVVKTIAIPVEKKVPYPVEKIVPVPVEKPVPITVERHIPVPVEKPYPIHIPIYKHVFHRKTKKHGHWIY